MKPQITIKVEIEPMGFLRYMEVSRKGYFIGLFDEHRKFNLN